MRQMGLIPSIKRSEQAVMTKTCSVLVCLNRIEAYFESTVKSRKYLDVA